MKNEDRDKLKEVPLKEWQDVGYRHKTAKCEKSTLF